MQFGATVLSTFPPSLLFRARSVLCGVRRFASGKKLSEIFPTMQDIFKMPAGAFAAFLNDTIVVEARRGDRLVQGTFRACVIDNGFAPGIVDGDAESDVRTYSIQVAELAWVDNTRPQVGDRITLEDDRLLAVSAVEKLGGYWQLAAREVAR